MRPSAKQRAPDWTRPGRRVSRRGCRRQSTRRTGAAQPARQPPSFENLDLWIEWRGNAQRRTACPLQVRVEKAVQAVGRNGKLPTSIDTELTQHTEHPPHATALQEGAVVPEGEVECAADRDAQPPVRGEPLT